MNNSSINRAVIRAQIVTKGYSLDNSPGMGKVEKVVYFSFAIASAVIAVLTIPL